MKTLLAITRDTLLMLCRRRLFWLHLWLNVAIVLLYASVAFNERGMSFGFGLKTSVIPWLKQGTEWENTMHCWIIARIMRWWVVGGGVFLALFSTAAVLPETLEPGRASLILPQARRRSLILGGRFLGSLCYVLLHTVILTGGLWLVARSRMGEWHHALWLGVPLAALLFISLQAVAMFMGVITRSAAAALLVAILFAGSVWTIQESAADPDSDAASAVAAQEAPEDPQGSGLSEALSQEALQTASSFLPQARNSLLWLEREACPQPHPAFSYRLLFRRLRVGHSGFGAIAADVIAAASAPGKKPEAPVAFMPIVASSTVFSFSLLGLAVWLLKRRDL